MNSVRAYDILERLASFLRAEERKLGSELGLQPVHLRTLRFLARANRYSNSPVAVAEYLGLTKGTASQTLIRLQEKQLVSTTPDTTDRRKLHLHLTRAGRRVVTRVSPPKVFERAFGLRDASSTAGTLESSLSSLLMTLQRLNGSRPFGICRTCAHFERNDTRSSFRCGLTGEPLKARETSLICREHSPLAETDATTW